LAPVAILAAYTAGIILPGFFRPGEVTGQVLSVGVLLLIWVLLRRSHWAWLPFLCLLLLAGNINTSLAWNPPLKGNDLSRFAGVSPMIIEGTVLSVEYRRQGGYRLQVEALQVIDNQTAVRATGTVVLYIKEGQLQARPGQVVRWRSALHL